MVFIVQMCQCRKYNNVEKIEVEYDNDINERDFDSDDDDF